jgi:hypothetical protein
MAEEFRHRDPDAPAEGPKREAQDRPSDPLKEARSPVDKLDIEAPTQQDNVRGHHQLPQRDKYQR